MSYRVAGRTGRTLPLWPLVALAMGSFAFVTAETLPVGLLPQIADGLDVSEARVGLLLTTYAAVAAVTTIPLTALTVGFRRDRLIAGCLAVFALAQVLAAVAPTFEVLTAARLIAAPVHGIFWAVVAPVAARLAPAHLAGRATSLVFVGSSIALVAGVPLGTALGQATTWRVAFAVLGGLGALAAVAVLVRLPRLDPVDENRATATRIRAAVAAVADRGVARVCLVTVVVVIGHFAAYTYIAPLVERAGGLDGFALSALLLGFGVMGLAGTITVGRVVDRHPGPVLAGFVAVAAVSVAVLATTSGPAVTVVAALLWGIGFSAVPVSLQSAILRVAPQGQDTASAVYVVAFQIGIGGGAFLGERIVGAGGLGVVPLVAAGTALAATVLVITSRRVFPVRIEQPMVATADAADARCVPAH
ncbi:MFS transporter [Jatrophihabitans fulvus]